MAEARDLCMLEQAVILLDEWIEAYEQLRRDHMALMHRYTSTKNALGHARYAIEFDLLIDELEHPKPVSECPF